MNWHPGIYEGITEAEALAQVGTQSKGFIEREAMVIHESKWNDRTDWSKVIGDERIEKRREMLRQKFDASKANRKPQTESEVMPNALSN